MSAWFSSNLAFPQASKHVAFADTSFTAPHRSGWRNCTAVGTRSPHAAVPQCCNSCSVSTYFITSHMLGRTFACAPNRPAFAQTCNQLLIALGTAACCLLTSWPAAKHNSWLAQRQSGQPSQQPTPHKVGVCWPSTSRQTLSPIAISNHSTQHQTTLGSDS